MLVLQRKEGQWVDVVHKSGDVIRIRVYGIDPESPGRCQLAFDDAPRNFDVRRPERKLPVANCRAAMAFGPSTGAGKGVADGA
jgi:sRNA-binding carbon storage regulator CsrA